jgi:hypothetical protein
MAFSDNAHAAITLKLSARAGGSCFKDKKMVKERERFLSL